MNYYIVAPTANQYAILLGTDGAYGATLVGASSLAAIVSAILYSWWYTRGSFRSALLVSALCPCLGNLLYSLAISYKSMGMAIGGRIMVGLGSAEVINRQLISTCVSFHYMTKASALFVAAGASGMSIGPLLAAILDIVSGRDTKTDLKLPFMSGHGLVFNHVTNPGFVMSIFWFLELVALVVFFHEPTRINASGSTHEAVPTAMEEASANYGSVKLMLPVSVDPNITKKSSFGPHHGTSCWQELQAFFLLFFQNIALPITMFLFAFIELVDEVIISSCSMVCKRYFGWHGSSAGFLIASLGALVLPAHFVVEKASHQYEERAIMKVSTCTRLT